MLASLLFIACIGQVFTVIVFWCVLPSLRITRTARMEAKLDENQAKLDAILMKISRGAGSSRSGPSSSEYEFTDEQEGVIKGVKTMIYHASTLFGVIFLLKELAAFARISELDIEQLAGEVADGFDFALFGLFLWKAKESFKVGASHIHTSQFSRRFIRRPSIGHLVMT